MPQNKKLNMKFEIPVSALERWDHSIVAKKQNKEDHYIDIFSTVGEYGDGSGITAKQVSEVLKKADGKDITVNINSGGGDFFEGLAINTLLSDYKGNVNVKVLGLAASAASLIALAGDTISIGNSALIMIHNAWTMAIGNKNDMQEAADMLSKFDDSMATMYSKKTGIEKDKIKKMMSEETWLSSEDAIDMKFADSILGEDEIATDETMKPQNSALRKLEISLAKAGMPRSERRSLLKELTSTPSAAETKVMPSADRTKELVEALNGLLNTITRKD